MAACRPPIRIPTLGRKFLSFFLVSEILFLSSSFQISTLKDLNQVKVWAQDFYVPYVFVHLAASTSWFHMNEANTKNETVNWYAIKSINETKPKTTNELPFFELIDIILQGVPTSLGYAKCNVLKLRKVCERSELRLQNIDPIKRGKFWIFTQ